MTGRPVSFIGALAAILGAGVAWAATDVRVVVEPQRVPSDGTVQLRVIVQGNNVSEVAPPSLSDLESWSVIDGPAISSQFRFVNGVSSTSRSFRWILAPARPGTLTIPSLIVELNDTQVATEVVRVEVYDTAGSGPAARGPDRGPAPPAEEVFLRTVLEPLEPYVGQQAVLRYDLYTRVEIASVPQAQETPVYPNFWKEDLEGLQRITPRIEKVDGRDYHVYTVRKVALFPTASGETILPPLTFSIPVKSQRSTRFRRSFFFDPVETVYKRAPRVRVNVRPLPADGRPADFSNAVGRFRLDAEADRAEAQTGEAIGLAVAIEGTGNLNSVKEPQLIVPPEFTVYPPEVRQSISPDRNDRFTGVKSWKYILVAREPGLQRLPEVRFSYFDPEAGEYRTLTAGNAPIDISGAALSEDLDAGLPVHRAIERLGSDIHFIHTASGTLSVSDRPLYRTGWFWLGLLAPPLANFTTVLVRWQRRRYAVRFVQVRRRRARRTALRRLRKAETALGDDGEPRFFGLVAQAMTEYVADRFGGHGSGLTYDRIATLMATNPASERASREFIDVLETCDCARFAPATAERAAREQLLERARQAILRLEGAS